MTKRGSTIHLRGKDARAFMAAVSASREVEQGIITRQQAEADLFADAPVEGCSRCAKLANEGYELHLQLEAATDLLSRLLEAKPGGVYFAKWEKQIEEVLQRVREQ